MKSSTERVLWIAGLVVALGLRVMATVERAGSATLLDQIDSRIYRNLADAIHAQGLLPEQGFFMSPLYPYWIAALSPTGPFPLALLVQSLLGVGAIAALALVARRDAGPTAGVFTLMLGALAAPLLLYDTAVLPDGPAFSLLAGALSLAILAPQHRRALWIAGTLGALAYALRSNLLPTLIAAGLWLAWRQRPHWGAGMRPLVTFATPIAVIMLAIGLVNLRTEGVFVPRSINAGQNLYIGNNPTSDGTYTPVNEIHPGDMLGRAAAQRVAGRPLNAAEVDAFWRERATRLMSEHPARTVGLWAKKLLLSIHPYDVPQMESLALTRVESRAGRTAFVGLGLVLPLAVAGLWGLWSGRRGALTPLILCGLFSVAICVLFFVNGRLRHPLWIALLPLAGIGLADTVALVGGAGTRRDLVRLGAGVLVLLLVSLYPVHATYREAMSACRYATLEALAQNPPGARRWMSVADGLETESAWWSDTPRLQSTFADHPETQWLLRLERAAAWFVLGDLPRAFQDMAPAAEGLPQSRRAQEGLIQICDGLLSQPGTDTATIRGARDRAVRRLQAL